MSGLTRPLGGGWTGPPALRSAHVAASNPHALGILASGFEGEDLALVVLFVSPQRCLKEVVGGAASAFPDTRVIACTTAGEISSDGYTEGAILAIGLPRRLFSVEAMLVRPLSQIDPHTLQSDVIRMRSTATWQARGQEHQFAFVLIDGLSLKEDQLMAALVPALGTVPLFGGSAGDGTRFEKTLVALDGKVHQDAAVLTIVRTVCPVRIFSLDHLTPTDQRMIVTEADPSRRIVSQLNAEPAAREYARVLGKDCEQLSPFTFAAHPLVVRFGGRHHVRAIQRVTAEGNLVFFSAIDEGLVLNVAEPVDMARHLDRALSGLAVAGRPEAILACDCILRRLEAEQKQMTRRVSDVLAAHRVVGFSTYGEQYRSMHVNHTMTGVAIYAPAH